MMLPCGYLNYMPVARPHKTVTASLLQSGNDMQYLVQNQRETELFYFYAN